MIEDRYDSVDPRFVPASPYTRAVAVTPSDTDDLTFRTRALLATAAGTVVVHMQGMSTPVTLQAAAGIALPVRVDRVLTGGTATGIIALD